MRKIGLLLAAAMLLGLSGCGAENTAPELLEPVEVLYDTAAAFRGDISYLEVYGAFVAAEMEEASFENGGKLKAVYVRAGDRVEAGELLAELDTEQLERNLSAVEKSAWQYEIGYQYSLAQRECDLAVVRLQREEAAGGKTLQVLKADKAAADAAITALKAEIAALELQITSLQTPASPTPEGETPPANDEALTAAQTSLEEKKTALAEKETEAADLQSRIAAVEAADLSILQIENNIAYLQDDYWLQMAEFSESITDIEEQIAACSLYAQNSGTVCTVTQNQAGASVSGTLVYIAVAGTEYVCYNGGRDISRTTAHVEANVNGTVCEMTLIPYSNAEYTALSRGGVTPAARFAFPEGMTDVRLGDYVQLMLYTGTRENVILVPINTVNMGSAYAESHVYRMVDGQRVYTPVTVGIVNDLYAEIRSGLAEGDVVYARD